MQWKQGKTTKGTNKPNLPNRCWFRGALKNCWFWGYCPNLRPPTNTHPYCHIFRPWSYGRVCHRYIGKGTKFGLFMIIIFRINWDFSTKVVENAHPRIALTWNLGKVWKNVKSWKNQIKPFFKFWQWKCRIEGKTPC